MDDLVQGSRDIINKGSQSFAAAARLFDKEIYEHAIMLYAWCRYCDDQIDGQVLGHGQRSPPADEQNLRLHELREQTHNAITGKPVNAPVFQALRRVFEACQIPSRYPMELLDGFAMDIAKRTYGTMDDTLTYCYHVAGTVGAMMAHIMGVRDSAVLDRAIDLGLAFQLTNICRDVLQDAEDKRIYLPEERLRRAGIPMDPGALAQHTEALCVVCTEMLDEADQYYASAIYGIGHLPFKRAWAIAGARAVYRDIGRMVRAYGKEAWSRRVYTSSSRKTWLFCTSFFQAAAAVLIKKHQKMPTRQRLWSAPEIYPDNTP